MKVTSIVLLSAAVLAGNLGATNAQTPSPGTVGAMNDTTRGIATSAEDVRLQQEGRGTAAEGASVLNGRSVSNDRTFPAGTVGAAPGSGQATSHADW